MHRFTSLAWFAEIRKCQAAALFAEKAVEEFPADEFEEEEDGGVQGAQGCEPDDQNFNSAKSADTLEWRLSRLDKLTSATILSNYSSRAGFSFCDTLTYQVMRIANPAYLHKQ